MNPTPRPAPDKLVDELIQKAKAAFWGPKTVSQEARCQSSRNESLEDHSRRDQSLRGARLRKHVDYQRAYSLARKRQSASMSWFMAPQPAGEAATARVGLTAGKVLGKAHERNRIKRRMREALRRHIELLPAGFDLIFHPRRTVLTLEFAKLEAEIVRILEQARVEAARLSDKAAKARPASQS
jgi:ribonuclease P protein component